MYPGTNWMFSWNQTPTTWPNQQSAPWPNQSSAPWPNQTPAPWPNQSPAKWPNQTNGTTGCSNGPPVSITNHNYYPACSHAPAGSAPAPAWNTQPAVAVPAPPATSLLHPTLCSTPFTYPHLSWSIGRTVSTARICTRANADHALSNTELTTQAVHPSISAIRIHVSALREWEAYWGPIIVPQLTSQGIRFQDVLQGIFSYFQTPLTRVEIRRLGTYRDLVDWQAERRARELPNGGVSSEVERNRGLLRIDLVWAVIGGVKFAGMQFAVMQQVGGWSTGEFLLNLTN
ncbi:hypothetical protein K443DRAFT_679643 [Laccaria amethystina LaAM-08-1]|uniref:DUF6699 domain-containing protein n=1 Tax=Laccaria amethystina LaAM-08-1 TaxID=1095629 RepID=A0A0C9XQE5_9AGAR|nr:hypothetical protein K443DRAFT_679643 [Laccaria amethystina LaAM-08-1]